MFCDKVKTAGPAASDGSYKFSYGWFDGLG